MAKTIWPKLPKAFKKKWLKALRSGDYQQGEAYLKNKSWDEATEYCCLGVACEVAGAKINMKKYPNFIESGCGIRGIKKVPKVLIGGEDNKVTDRLASMNDSGRGFKAIANWIEKNL
jgi:hypothetical protein